MQHEEQLRELRVDVERIRLAFDRESLRHLDVVRELGEDLAAVARRIASLGQP